MTILRNGKDKRQKAEESIINYVRNLFRLKTK